MELCRDSVTDQVTIAPVISDGLRLLTITEPEEIEKLEPQRLEDE